MAGGSPAEVAPVLEQTNLPNPKSENGYKKPELRELLSRPDLLTKASYLLLSLTNFNPQEVDQKLTSFFTTGEIPPEDTAAYNKVQSEHQGTHFYWKKNQLEEQHQRFQQDGLLNTEAENINDLYCVHSTDFVPTQKDGQIVIATTYQGSESKSFRTSVHFALNHTVGAVSGMGEGHSWTGKDYVVISPFRGIIELNGPPYGVKPEDTFWAEGIEKGIKLPAGTKIVARKGDPKTTEIRAMGLEVIEVDGDPHAQTENVMQEGNMKVIYPSQFKGAQKIADQLGSFYGYHLGSAKRAGSESYLQAEAAVMSTVDNRQAETVAKLVESFNGAHVSGFPEWDQFVRLQALHELVFQDYFSAADFPEVALVHPQNGHEVSFDEAIAAMKAHYYSRANEVQLPNVLNRDPDFHKRMVAWVGLNIFDQLSKIAKTGKELPSVSGRMLKDRVQKVKDNFDIIPPQLIGSFAATTYSYL